MADAVDQDERGSAVQGDAPEPTYLTSCGKRMAWRRKLGGIETTRSTVVSVIALAGAYLVVGRLVLELLVLLGFLGLQRHILIMLAALASVGFVASSLVLKTWAPTASMGQVLGDRIMNTRVNWETDTLRSFCEVGIWLSVIWSTYEATEGGVSGSVSALLCGTIAGVLVVFLGEAMKAPLRDLEKLLREPSAGAGGGLEELDNELSLDSGSMMLLALFGFSAISTIYENVTDVVVSCGLASLGGLGILTVAKVIQVFEPTRCIGITLQSRLLNTFENWRLHPMRSALESTFFTSVVFSMYAVKGDWISALQVGTLSGIAVILTGEIFEHGVMMDGCAKQSRKEVEEDAPICPPIILAYGSFAVCVGIYAMRERQLLEAALSTIVNCICWVLVASISSRCTSTCHAGRVINDRIIHAADNWVELPLRSLFELSVWIVAQLACFAGTKSVFASALAGTVAGLIAVLLCEALGWGHLPWQEGLGKNKAERKAQNPLPGQSRAETTFTWAEIEEHSSPDDIWLAIDGKVYDVTEWAPSHPGGSIIFKFAGVDASDQFAAFHQPRVAKRLPRFLIGRVAEEDESNPSPCKPSGPTLDYRALRERLWKEGYFQPSLDYYIRKGLVCAVLFVGSVSTVLFMTPSLTRALVSAVLLGFSLQQVAFVTHDAAHNGVVTPASGGGFNWLAWFLGSCIFGISPAMWNEEHSIHHAITLRPCEDPQFNYLPIWLISPKELDVPGVKVDFLMRKLVSIQHYSFLPLAMIIGRFNFHLISIAWAMKHLLTAPSPRQAFTGAMDVAGMLIYFVWFGILVAQFETVSSQVLFVLVTYITVGILHVQLILSHAATNTFTAQEERELQFFKFQMLTTRNFDASWYDHWFHGGLEYQIEHHLFPQLPRHALAEVQPFVQELCKRHGIPYTSTSASGALLEVLSNLRALSSALVHVKMG